jgi:hypothetical protein
MFSPKAGIAYILLVFIGAIILNNTDKTMWVITAGTSIVVGLFGIFFTIVNNRR